MHLYSVRVGLVLILNEIPEWVFIHYFFCLIWGAFFWRGLTQSPNKQISGSSQLLCQRILDCLSGEVNGAEGSPWKPALPRQPGLRKPPVGVRGRRAVGAGLYGPRVDGVLVRRPPAVGPP